jgi:hypothetical protein
MFLQEIENVESIKKNWIRHFFFPKYMLKIPDPQKLNRFIKSIMDPFKDREEEEEEEEKRRRNKMNNKNMNKQLVCWPFCYFKLEDISQDKLTRERELYHSKIKEIGKQSLHNRRKTKKYKEKIHYEMDELVQVKTSFDDDGNFLWCDAEIKDMDLKENTLLVKYCNSNYTTIIDNNNNNIRKKKLFIKENTDSEDPSNTIENIVLNIQGENTDNNV